MKPFKLFILLIMTILSVSSNICAQEQQDSVVIVDSTHFRYFGIRYTFNEDGKSLMVDRNYDAEIGTQINIVRQITINGKTYPVTRIGKMAFYGCRAITCVTIPDNVSEIDSAAFRWCVNLSNIGISSKVKVIKADCFRNCTNLRFFNFPNGLNTIHRGAFKSSGLLSISLPEGLLEIGAEAFEDCKSLKTVNFPRTIRKIGENAFKNCWSLKTISLYDRVKLIDKSAFAACRSLTTVVFTKVYDSSVKTIIAADVFADCKSLKTVICNTGRTGKVKDVVFHENTFNNSSFNLEQVIFGGSPATDTATSKRKKKLGESDFEEDEIEVDEDNIERIRTSETVKRARKNTGVRKKKK